MLDIVTIRRAANADRLLDPLRTRRVAGAYERALIARLRRIKRLVLRTLANNAPSLDIYGTGLVLNQEDDPPPRGPGFLDGSATEQGEQMRRYTEEIAAAILLLTGIQVLDTTYYATAAATAYRAGLAQAARLGGITAAERRILLRSPSHLTAARALARGQVSILTGLSEAISRDVRDAVVDGIRNRETAAQIAARIEKRFDVAETRAQVIARTEVTRAHAEGSLNAYLGMRFEKVTALVEWTLNIHGDAAPCPLCIALAGQVFSIAEARGRIPLHPRCQAVPWYQPISSSVFQKGYRRQFSGECFALSTTSGEHATVTANHPVLTNEGLIAARLLDPSRHRLALRRNIRAAVKFDEEHKPAIARDVFQSLALRSDFVVTKVPTSAANFHGDSLDCDVDVVWPHRDLLLYLVSGLPQALRDHMLVIAGVGHALLDELRAPMLQFSALNLATADGPSCGHVPHAFPRRPQPLGFRGRSEPTAGRQSGALDVIATHAARHGNGAERFSGQIALHGVEFVEFSVSSHGVVDLEVYDFQTASSLYEADGIVVSNCGWTPVFDRASDRR